MTATAARRQVLAGLVAKVFHDSRGTYGLPAGRGRAQPATGTRASVGLVAELMRELGLLACQPRGYKRTTIAGEEPVETPDLIGREFTASAPGQRLVGDITYLRTGEGWLYLATVIDLATRMVVGWQLAEHMRTSLVTDALAMAITGGHVTGRGDLSQRPGLPIHIRRVRPVLRRQPASGPASGGPGCAGTTPPPSRSSPP